jgi:hypothetical protein
VQHIQRTAADVRTTLCTEFIATLIIEQKEFESRHPQYPTKEFHRGENIAPYSGDIIPEDDLDPGDLYALQIKKTPPRMFISARRTNTGAGRYANARRGDQGDNNSQLVYDRVGRVGNVRATTTIRPEQEITVPYGRGYWRGRGLAESADKYIARLPASTNSQ